MGRIRARRQQKPPPPCLFCGSAGPMSAEHIFGDWLHKLGYTGEGIRETVLGEGATPIIAKGGPFSKKLKVVCRTCNNTWMSQLEADVKLLLTAMFNAGDSKVALDQAAQAALARWAFKTVAVASQIGGSPSYFPAHCDEFYQTRLPPRRATVRIGAATIPTQALGENLGEFKFNPKTATVTVGSQARTFPLYRASFRLLNVVFDVFGYVTDEVDLAIDPSEDLGLALLPLWPPQHPKIWWPPVTSLDAVGGVTGLAAGQLVSLPTLLAGTEEVPPS